MARQRTLTELILEVRQRADIENSTHITDAEITRMLNQSTARLYGEISQRCEGDYAVKTTITTVAGTESYSMPATFWRLASIPPITDISGRRSDLRRWSTRDRASLLDPVRGWTTARPVYYRLMAADQISFLPVPDGVYSVDVWYIPASPEMTLGSDKFDGRNGWEEFVILDAVIKCITKEEGDASVFAAERETLRREILEQAASKDLADTDRVQDVERSRWAPWGLWE